MPRTGRQLVDGGTYHVLTRGNNGQAVFHHDADFQRYLQIFSACAKEHGLRIHHYALMPNHVHLVLQAAVGQELSRAMLSANLTYSLFYRRAHRYTGHLWQGRFKSLLIDRDSYLGECGRYIELNPVRAGLVQDPANYPWSSYRAYAEGKPDALLTRNPLYEGLGRTTAERQLRYREFIAEGIRMHEAKNQQPERPSSPYGLLHQKSKPPMSLETWLGLSRGRGRGRPKRTPVLSGDVKGP